LREWTEKARRRARGRPLFYTEWNCSSNPRYAPQDDPYAAAFVVKTILEAAGLVECYSFWTFSDIFEEIYFPSVPFHGGFGMLNLHGIPKPNYRAFELLHQAGNELLSMKGNHATVDAWTIRQPGKAMVLLTNHALPRQPIQPEQVRIRFTDAPQVRSVTVQRIDEEHANAKRAWQQLGEPEYLNQAQVQRLQAASQLVSEPLVYSYEMQTLEWDLPLPQQAVAAVTIAFANS
jgi:xylan 1,4-beta-xylosidase